MTSKTTTVLTCDVCKLEIGNNEHYINAGTYGADAHTKCAINLDFFSTVKLLNLDDIKYMRFEDWENARKVVSCTSKELI